MIFSKHNFLVYYCQLNQIKMKVYFRWQYLGNGTRYWHAVFAGRQTVSGSSFLVRQCPMTSGLNSEIRSFENVKKCKICKKSIFYKRCAITLRIFWRLQPLSNFQPLTKYRPFQHENCQRSLNARYLFYVCVRCHVSCEWAGYHNSFCWQACPQP